VEQETIAEVNAELQSKAKKKTVVEQEPKIDPMKDSSEDLQNVKEESTDLLRLSHAKCGHRQRCLSSIKDR